MYGGQTTNNKPVIEEEIIFDRYARQLMYRWDYSGFVKKFSTLFLVIKNSMRYYAMQEVNKYKAKLEKDAEEAKKEKDIKDTSDTKPPVHGKRFARKPKANMIPYCQRYINKSLNYKTLIIECELMLESGEKIRFHQVRSPKYTFKPHRNIRRRRVRK